MYITCEKCKYNHDYVCHFYVMNHGNEIDMPCYREKELMKGAVDNFLQALFSTEDKLVKDSINAVLDKIRAEIEEQKKERCFDDDDMFVYRSGLDDALYIIDKYKAESDPQESEEHI